MLVLSRQRDEKILIGDDIEVTVVDIRGDKVRLGITAPKSVAVHRKEVYEQIKRENREAAQVQPDDFPGIKLPQKDRTGEPKDAVRPPDAKPTNASAPEAQPTGGTPSPGAAANRPGAKPEAGETTRS